MAPWTDTHRTGVSDPQAPHVLHTRRPSLLITLIAAGTLALAVPTVHAKPTPAQKCAVAKNKAAGKYAACLQTVIANSILSADPNKATSARDKCRTTFLKAWAAAEAKATTGGATCDDAPLTVDDFDDAVDTQSFVIALALNGNGLRRCGDNTRQGSESCDGNDVGAETCVTRGFAGGTVRCASGCVIDTSGCFAARYVDNGDGTVTDHQTGLQWEQKVSPGGGPPDPHDVDNTYTWSVGGTDWPPNGTAFTEFLAALNNGTCFAGHCDWRLPTESELYAILDVTLCTGSERCLPAVFGPVSSDFYFTATSVGELAQGGAGVVNFHGFGGSGAKSSTGPVLAVRTGS